MQYECMQYVKYDFLLITIQTDGGFGAITTAIAHENHFCECENTEMSSVRFRIRFRFDTSLM